MAAAHAIIRAYIAIHEANGVLEAAGMTGVEPPEREIKFAGHLALLEPIVCLREPARQLVTLIANRAAVLAKEEAVRVELDANENWGMF